MPRSQVPDWQRMSAKRLRRNMTDAEQRLWQVLRAHRFRGHAFRRQAPIGPYIVDFVSHSLKLVIEVDGGQHATSRGDAARDAWLSARGYRVRRFWNNEVLGNLEGVLERLDRLAAHPPPHPSPARGEGAASRPAGTTPADRRAAPESP